MSPVPDRRVLRFLTLALFAASASAAPRTEVTSEVSVREVEIGVALPDDLSPFKVRALDSEDFLVVRDGKSQQVVRAERVMAKDRAWTQVVWVDRVLASPRTVYETVRGLGDRSADLARMGTVDVVIADPLPRVDLAGGSDTPAVRRALEDAAAAASTQRSARGASAWTAPDNAALRRQSDRIVAWIAGRKAVGPRTFWLPLDGVALSMAAIGVLGGEQAASAAGAVSAASATGSAPAALSAEESDRVRILVDLERALAAYGWTTLVLIDRPAGGVGGAPNVEGDFDRWHGDLPDHGRPGSNSGALSLRWPPRAGGSRFDPRTLDALLDPRFAAPRLLAQESGGWMLAGPWDYPATLDSLARRWRVWIRAPENDEGELHPVTVTLRKGPELRASRWLRSATPAAVAEARLREALENERSAPGTTLAARLARDAAGSVPLEVAPAAGGQSTTVWRWLVGVQGADGKVVIQPAAPELRDGAWRTRLTVPPGARLLAVARDDLHGDAYGIAVLKPPTAP